jgi:hypothetical protein
LPTIPPAWRSYFARVFQPPTVTPPTLENLPDDDQRFLMAVQQPGATRRGDDIKFQCPACVVAGGDTAQDNARLFKNAKWGCAVYPRGVAGSLLHWMAIGIALEVFDGDGGPGPGKKKVRIPR